MTDPATRLLDDAIVGRLIETEEVADLRRRVDDACDAETALAGRLRHMAVRGDLDGVLDAATGMCARADELGLRRLANRLVELERVAALDALGQAHLQTQALTRLIDEDIETDFAALRDVVRDAIT